MPYQIGPQVLPERMEDMSPLANALQSFNQNYGQMLRNRYQNELDKVQPQTMQAQLQKMQLGNQSQQISNQYLPKTLSEKLKNMQLMDQYQPLLMQAKLQSAQNAGLTPLQKMYQAYQGSKPGSQQQAMYAMALNNQLAPKSGATITMPNGQTINLGGQTPAGLFPVPGMQQSNPQYGGPSTSISTLQKSGRGNSGALVTQRDADGNIIAQNSAETNKNMTQNQNAAQALQTLAPFLHSLVPAAQYNWKGGGLLKDSQALLNKMGLTQSDLEDYNAAKGQMSSLTDTLAGALGVPRTNVGLHTVVSAFEPREGETQKQYKNRIDQVIIPELSHRYSLIRNALINGQDVTPYLNFEQSTAASPPIRAKGGNNDPLGIR